MRDSNSRNFRSTVFKTASFDHSDNSPRANLFVQGYLSNKKRELIYDLSSNSGICEDLKDHGMFYPAVNDMCLAYAL